jgi:hypothetical protein
MTAKFSEATANRVYVLSKKHRGEVKTLEAYHKELGEDPITIIVKGSDNSHNVQSMHGAFKPEKIASYLEDTKANKLPLLRLGRKLFPEYHFAFAGLSFMLKRQVELYTSHQTAMKVEARRTAGEMTKIIANRDAASGASNAVLVERMQEANKAIQADLNVAREQVALARSASNQGLAFERSKYQNFSLALVKVLAQELKGPELQKVWQELALISQEPGTTFELPSEMKVPSQLGFVDDSHADFDGAGPRQERWVNRASQAGKSLVDQIRRR